jgi:hypothetical protein
MHNIVSIPAMERENTTSQSDCVIEMEEGSKVGEVPKFENEFAEPALPKWRLVTLIVW